MMDIALALVIPFLLMIVVTRVTFSLIGACIVTWMVAFFVLGIHEQSWMVGVVALLSFAGGLVVARKRLQRKPGM
ncbi:DUF2198 family protein [Halalkalibacter nanhaiisediminis]|uniref:Uncharacterized protein DUF2198 n=1 Tax=Halalkalibacter nanhaiisediminis TaxID=688079 RepID=A0A562QT81_9BACI|nr:DUF2198 family protein [Halalkalibacter nanhaiisediminis]TWI59978.1 uncharacterized protein DUF2198 [Halalkalibacter nanhaiisediminis]